MPKIIEIKVSPGAKLNQVVVQPSLDGSQQIKVYVTQQPEDGKANKAVLKLLADYYDIRVSQLEIISGHLSRNKKIQIHE